MDTGSSENESCADSKRAVPTEERPRTIWAEPMGRLVGLAIIEAWGRRKSLTGFLSLTGGSILYCLSALSIIYGIIQIIGPTLAKSNVLGEILPCVLVLNVYELALLAVLVLIVVWRNVTDDAISLVVLVGLFLIASGMMLGTAVTSGPATCLYIGLAFTAVGLGKLYVMRRFISFGLSGLSFVGVGMILVWNFLNSSVIAKVLAAGAGTDEVRRYLWLVFWLLLLGGAVLVIIDSTRGARDGPEGKRTRTAFLHSRSMVWIFVLVLLGAASLHQYGIAYMFVIDYAFGDFIPLIAVGSVLMVELMRGLGREFKGVGVLVSCVPLVSTISAVLNKSVMASWGMSVEVLWHPAVVLGLTGIAIVLLGIGHRWHWLLYVALAYGLGFLLTVGYSPDKPDVLNWHLCGGGLVAMLLILGVVQRNVFLCFGAVLVLSVGLGLSDMFSKFAEAQGLTRYGAAAGVGGLGTMVICLAFGPKVPRGIVLLGAVSLVGFVFDYLPSSLGWRDVPVAAVTVVLCIGLWLRTRQTVATVIVCIPVVRRLYIVAREMSSWGFIVLSFFLLFSGAAVSLFCKRKKSSRAAPESESPEA